MRNEFEYNLEFIANTLQILSFLILMRDASNETLSKKLDEVIEQNNRILALLQKEKT